MSENANAKETPSATVSAMKFRGWQLFGSLVTDLKKDASGHAYPAMSITRVLLLVMFLSMITMWFLNPEAETPDAMMQAFWGLLGLKGVNKVTEAVGKK